ncbi:hypothetical protein CQW23_30816 [Capsicum baccatum]|uniref:Phytocyanin domain-containing protein n=1 Tax=Capsicum baccatum TaxID=33114 RepID=A0A2G2V9C8_CAPBA|nr:hypothetical protein CQW23_30816 [Capsicum baccatum]
MEVVRRRSFGWPIMALMLTCALLVMLPKVYSVRYIVGSRFGWTTFNKVNYTNWVKDKHFYKGDSLFFVYDKHMMNVLELNKTDYEQCNTDHPLHNWTTGTGRDIVPLDTTKTYYFASGYGFCYGGMKVAIHVEKAPLPSKAAPVHSGSTNYIAYHGFSG